MDLIKGLFRRLPLPNVWDEITNNVLHSLVSDFSFAGQFLPQSLLNLPELHLVVIISLLEGGSRIRIVRVWVLPEFAHECDSLLAVPPLLPVWNKATSDEGAIKLFFERIFSNAEEVVE